MITPVQLSPTCVYCRADGNVDCDAFIALFEELFQITRSLKGLRIYCDLTHCDSTLEFTEELRIVEHIRGHWGQFEGSKWAFVTESLLLYGLARMGQLLTADFPFQYEIFHRTPHAAITWLGCTKELLPVVNVR